MPKGYKGTVEERFWRKVDKRGENDCWNWIGGHSSSVRGGIRGIFTLNGRPIRAYRISYILHYGSIPDGKEICHHCDNPLCVNPKHLFAGTRRDNVLDMYKKGRGNPAYGERNAGAKLTEKIILEIRGLLKQKVPHRIIAQKYNIDKGRVSRIKNKIIWKCVKDEV